MITSLQVVAELRAQRHRVDDARVLTIQIDHDHLKELACAAWADHQGFGVVQLDQA
jgi:hypothetical protein